MYQLVGYLRRPCFDLFTGARGWQHTTGTGTLGVVSCRCGSRTAASIGDCDFSINETFIPRQDGAGDDIRARGGSLMSTYMSV